jgi:uncharacterized protein YigE (DUF2233 family)
LGFQFFVQPAGVIFIADEQITHVIACGFSSNGFERDFGADAGDIAECDTNPGGHENSPALDPRQTSFFWVGFTS